MFGVLCTIFFFNDTATTEIYTLSLHDALPIYLLTLWVCKLLMLICILTKNVITSCSVTMMLFLHLEVKPLMTLTTVLYLSCALISGHLAMTLMELTKQIGRAVQQECRDRSRMPSSA